jgi:hypothetical protein
MLRHDDSSISSFNYGEGAAKTVETQVFPALVKYVLAKRGASEKLPYYLATNQAGRNAFLAKTDATLQVLTRTSCATDSIEFAKGIGKSWGITDEGQLDDVAIRSHHGTSYFQYTAGEILYTAYVKYFSDALGQPVDPYTLQTCGLTFAPQDQASVEALRACLRK